MRFKKSLSILLLGVLIIVLIRYTRQPEQEAFITLEGTTMGPIPYAVKYIDTDGRNFQVAVDSLLIVFNNSLSTYISQSEISKFNTEDSIVYESTFFYPVLQRSKEIHEITLGAFDPTVGPLVNAWGFGPNKENKLLDSATVAKLKESVGFEKVVFDKTMAKKTISGIYLDFSAIAKGYGVDVVGGFLEQKGIENYMVEIGGEVRCRGVNANDQVWLIGIEDPTVASSERKLHSTVYLKDRSLATSGNYRNYYLIEGQKISHTINPFTGYPVTHSLLSASVFANDCMTADALATAFMVLGFQKAKEITELIDEVDAFLIYSDEQGNLVSWASEGIKNFTEKK